MTPPRSIVDLLVEQSEDSLKQMRDSLQAELARLTVEIEQVKEALARKTRKPRTGGGRLTRDQVYLVVRVHARPLTAAEVQDAIAKQGLTVSLNAVRNHLNRLVDDDHRLARYPEGRFGTPPPRIVNDIPDDLMDDEPPIDYVDDEEDYRRAQEEAAAAAFDDEEPPF